MGARSMPRWMAPAWIVFLIAMAWAMIVRQAPTPREDSDRFWAVAYSRQSIEAEHYDSLGAMTQAADLVVVGTIEAVAPGRVIVADAELANKADALSQDAGLGLYALATVRVQEVLSGSGVDVGDVVPLEVFASQRSKLEELLAKPSFDTGVFFLRNKGVEAKTLDLPAEAQDVERPFYRLVTRQGLIRNVEGSVATSSTAEAYVKELEGLPFDDAVDVVRGLSAP